MQGRQKMSKTQTVNLLSSKSFFEWLWSPIIMVQRRVVALNSCVTLVNCLNGGIALLLLRTLKILTQSLVLASHSTCLLRV